MGDGVIIEFQSVVAAVECAVAMQREVAERNEGIPKDRRLTYRMGANLGDVRIDGEDILGDGCQYRCAAGGDRRARRHLHFRFSLRTCARPDRKRIR